MTRENDLVLIHFEDRPLSYARIEAIEPDVKKDWFQVRLLILQVPLQTATWILRSAYIDGDEFTMGGNRMRLEKVVPPPEDKAPETDEAPENAPTEDAKPVPLKNPAPEPSEKPGKKEGDATVISLADRFKK